MPTLIEAHNLAVLVRQVLHAVQPLEGPRLLDGQEGLELLHVLGDGHDTQQVGQETTGLSFPRGRVATYDQISEEG